MASFSVILQIALPVPLRFPLDYLPCPEIDIEKLQIGMRIWVPFRRQKKVGILIGIRNETSLSHGKLKQILDVIDEKPLLTPSLVKLVQWASQYYHYPIGEVLINVMPALLRQGAKAAIALPKLWVLTSEGHRANASVSRMPAQAKALSIFKANPQGLSAQFLKTAKITSHTLNALTQKNWITPNKQLSMMVDFIQSEERPILNAAQAQAVEVIINSLGHFKPFLLDGVTGSGKTEVYLTTIEKVLALGKQALVLVPEIGLTPQTVARFQQRFNTPIMVLHSGLTERERLNAWLMAGNHEANIIIGTRSAIFTPMKALGLIIVDEEHDASYKQQDGFRYCARDLAIVRGKLELIPILLGSATPALESQYNVNMNRYQLLNLPERAGIAQMPTLKVVDIQKEKLQEGLSSLLIHRIRHHLQQQKQVLLFLNRRGFAPVLICHRCAWIAKCQRCDVSLVLHHSPYQLCCHHCAKIEKVHSSCPTCHAAELIKLGLGTERLEEALKSLFPHVDITRIDRDTVQNKHAWETLLTTMHSGKSQIFIGTQMLAKGHHLPHIALAAVIDTDASFLSGDIRASERMGQLIMQVAGRAGRSEVLGEVIIQTRYPHHPLLQKLVAEGYRSFSDVLLKERKQNGLAPFYFMALLRAESHHPKESHELLRQVRGKISGVHLQEVDILGPVPAPMEKKAGRYRAQLLIKSENRKALHFCLAHLLEEMTKLKLQKKVRWSLDIDPHDFF